MKIIAGAFFQRIDMFRIAHNATFGAVVVVEPKQLKNMFTGVIFQEPIVPYSDRNLSVPEGYIFDAYGFAYIFQYQETEKSVSFIKKYEHREDTIQYKFTKKEGEEWIGKWKGKATGDGFASCVIVPVSDQMLDIARFKNGSFKDKM